MFRSPYSLSGLNWAEQIPIVQCTTCIYASVYRSIYCDLRYQITHTRGKLYYIYKLEFFKIYANIRIKYKINHTGEKPYWRFKCHHSLQCNYFKSSLDNKYSVLWRVYDNVNAILISIPLSYIEYGNCKQKSIYHILSPLECRYLVRNVEKGKQRSICHMLALLKCRYLVLSEERVYKSQPFIQ